MALTQVAAGLLAGSITSSQITSVAASTLTGTQTIPRGTLPTGSVLQVVSTKSTTVISGTGNADLLSLSITPSSASNKILVSAFFASSLTPSTNAYMTGYIYRGTNSGTLIFSSYGGAQIAQNITMPWAGCVLDSPNTTSSQTYTLVAGKGSGGTTSWSTDTTSYSITLMEIAA